MQRQSNPNIGSSHNNNTSMEHITLDNIRQRKEAKRCNTHFCQNDKQQIKSFRRSSINLLNNKIKRRNIQAFGKQTARASAVDVAECFIEYLFDRMLPLIEKIQRKRIVRQAVCITQMTGKNLFYFQDPQSTLADEEPSLIPQAQPSTNQTDPTSGFNKEKFVPKTNSLSFMTKKMNDTYRQQEILQEESILKYQKRHTSITIKSISSKNHRKQLMPLKNVTNHESRPINNDRNASRSFMGSMEQLFRGRLVKKQQQLRKVKEKLSHRKRQSNIGIIINQKRAQKDKPFKRQSKSITVKKEDTNFDYNGEPIEVHNHGKIKGDLKILKSFYRIKKCKPEQIEKSSKLLTKVHEKLSYKDRQRSSKVVQDNLKHFRELTNPGNYSVKLKENLQTQMQRGKIQFYEKKFP